jgi:hypothetical protein
MEVMGPYFQRTVRESSQACRFDVNHVVLILKRTFEQKKPAVRHDEPVAFIEIGRDDHVGDACLIWQRSLVRKAGFTFMWTLPRCGLELFPEDMRKFPSPATGRTSHRLSALPSIDNSFAPDCEISGAHSSLSE